MHIGSSTGIYTHTSFQMCLSGIELFKKSINVRPTAPIVINSNVYIGGNSTIYPGITIGHHSIVAPNSAANKNIEPYTMGWRAYLSKTIKKIILN